MVDGRGWAGAMALPDGIGHLAGDVADPIGALRINIEREAQAFETAWAISVSPVRHQRGGAQC